MEGAVASSSNGKVEDKLIDGNDAMETEPAPQPTAQSQTPAKNAKPVRKWPKSFAIHVESTANTANAEAEGNVPRRLGESPALLKTFCKHEVSLPPDYPEDYDFTAAPSQTLGGEAVSSGPAKTYKFTLDAFQRESVKCLERRESVLVAAHTSAGKTAIAEYAIAMAFRDKQRVIYTSPIKALSNQKYRELEEEFGDVGLMTGDTTINKNASCLVMTTEILRSMLYRGSEVVREVAWVIFDEVHYMRDKSRGVVWEETIILVPHNVRFVFLSATIPNAREFSEWIAHLKNKPCHTVYTDTRPVPLQHYIYPVGGDGLHLVVDEKGTFQAPAFEKVLNSLKKSDDGGGGGGGGRRGGKSNGLRRGQRAPGKSDCFKLVKMIKERGLYPVIIFSFNRRECETLAMQMSKLDFNDENDQALVEKVFQSAIESLDEADQQLPQVTAMLPLLKKGIGIHHSGLLPIVKEVVELLFQEGLIKALFATETFSMGLNMPARTVVFTQITKYDGSKFRHMLSGEYVQMSGRAGRRGIDDRGVAILMVEEKIESKDAKTILSGTAEPLRSTFHLGYNMLLNLFRAEDADPEFVISRSLAQFQADRAIPECQEKLAELRAKRDAIEVTSGDLTEKQVEEYWKLRTVAESLRLKMREFVHKPQYIVQFLQPGRLARVHDIFSAKKLNFGWGVILSWKKGKKNPRYNVTILLRCVAGSAPKPGAVGKPIPFRESRHKSNQEEWIAVTCDLKDLDGTSAIRVYTPDDKESAQNRGSIGSSVLEVLKRFPQGPPMLDPFDDLKIEDKSFAVMLSQLQAAEETMNASAVEKSPDMRAVIRACEQKQKMQSEIDTLKKELKVAQGLILKDELKKMKRVLRRLGFMNEDGVVEVKGRLACEVNTADELVITELLLGGNLNEMAPEVLVALLSCFVHDDKKENDNLQLEKELAVGLENLKAVAKRVGTVAKESNIETNVDDFVKSFSPNIMRVVYHWCNGKSFAEVCSLSDVFEGSVVRSLRRLEELLRQLVSAARSIGNTELEAKFEAGSVKLKRGIAFSTSLYT